jgi:hypothetical protein
MGQRGAHTCDVIFDNVKVPAANLIGLQEGKGFKTAMKVLEKGRIHIAAVAVGCAKRILRDACSTRWSASSSARRSATSSWCRPCWPTARPSCTRPNA